MDLQTRKLRLIEYLIGLSDEKVFNVLEASIKSSLSIDLPLGNLTEQELIDRAKKSNMDYLQKKYIDQELLEKESDTW